MIIILLSSESGREGRSQRKFPTTKDLICFETQQKSEKKRKDSD